MQKGLYLNQKEFEKIFKNHLKITSYSMSIKTLFGKRLSRKIIYDPYYQRNYVWDKKKASFFIESILLGTDIPPLIFFNSGGKIEVIDGRQRFETIKRFKINDLSLTVQGLLKLPQLQRHTFNKLDVDIKEVFDSAKIRIFEFEVINEPKLDISIEDKIKKEIFRRYNSGITPLNTSEIDNAKYEDDTVTNYFKNYLNEDKDFLSEIIDCFKGPEGQKSSSKIATTLQLLRKYLVLTEFPINSYARGSNRTEIFELYYNFFSDTTENAKDYCKIFIKRLKIVFNLRKMFNQSELKNNKLIFECIFWAMNIICKETEKKFIDFDSIDILQIERHYNEHIKLYSLDGHFYYRSIIDRFKDTASFFGKRYNVNFDIYIKNTNFKNQLKDLRQTKKDAILKIQELDTLRVNKPDPSVVPVDEMITELSTNKYLLRPSYQREEKISIFKSSAIIESIILGINLPPIFICKNENGVKELVDGQQRLISILGYLGEKYNDENGNLNDPKNQNYALKKLKILKGLNNTKFKNLDEEIQDKILDFKIQTIEIDKKINPDFDPVDLFIRLNNKPYPIKENSFEMWNSFLDKDVIEKIRKITDIYIDWFFIKVRAKDKTRDRMLNEEMITMLAFISYKDHYENSLGVYKREQKLSCRIKEKKSISALLEELSVKELEKKKFIESIQKVENFITILRQLLLDDVDNESKPSDTNIKESLNGLFGLHRQNIRGYRKRSLVDFYFLFLLLGNIKTFKKGIVTFDTLKKDFRSIQNLLKNSTGSKVDDTYLKLFYKSLDSLISKYKSFC